MKKLLIPILSIIAFTGYSQVAIPSGASASPANVNTAIRGSITAGGTDTYSATYTGVSNVTGFAYNVTFTNANTGSSTFNLNAAGAVTIRKFESGSLVNLVSGDISAGETKRLRYNGTYLVIEGGSGGGGITDLTGDVTASGTGSVVASIEAGVIVDADVNASAAIAGTKLANTPAGGIAATTVQAAINELDTEKSGTLTNGNGTTANGSAVDLGGTATGDILIDDDGVGRNMLFGSTTPLGSIEMYSTGFIMGDIATRVKTVDIGASVFINNTLSGAASFRVALSSTALSLQTGTAGVVASRLSFNSAGNPTWTIGSDATGDMWYRNSSGFMTRIAPGAQNTILTMGASSVPAWSQTVLSGTYTPTLTNVANLDASTAYLCTYMRVGSTVTVSGRVDIDPTTTLTSTQLGISLPVASALSTANQAGGTANATAIAGQSAAIRSDATNDRAELIYTTTDVTNQPMYFSFTYQVL